MFKILINLLLLLFLKSPTARAGNRGRDFYDILGVSSDASKRQIKKAFRQLSLQFHPDKCDDKAGDCKDKFTDVNNAYEVLSDDKKREAYDSVGRDEERYKQWEKQGGGAGGGFNPFESFFGFGRKRGGDDGMPKTGNTRMILYVDLTQLYVGDFIEIRYYRNVLCQRVDECEINDDGCARAGIRKSTRRIGPGFVQQIEDNDSRCVARGKRYREKCKACPDGPTVQDVIPVTVDILPGMKDGQELQFEELADESIGHIPGDLIVVLRQTQHPHFVRDGDNLKLRLGIDLADALVGFETTIKHVDGHDVVIKSNEVIDCDYVKVIKAEGMPTDRGGFGDLIVTFEIEFPSKKFGNQQKQRLRNILKN